jgi:hypothetical protein
MDSSGSTHVSVQEYIEGFGGKARRDHYENLYVVGRIILKRILEK